MKILLTAINAKYIHSNLAVYSLMAYAEEYKEHIELAEYTINHRTEIILQEIYKKKPDVLCFSCYIWNFSQVCELIEEIHKLRPDLPVWVGGPEVSYECKDFLEEYSMVKGIMRGEGEETFLELCKFYVSQSGKLAGGDDRLSGIKGIVYRNDAGEILENREREPLSMDTLPFCYSNLDNFQNRIIYYETSRGCPFRCSYCLSSIEKSLRFRSLSLVFQELQFFLDEKVPQVKFVDRTFNCNHEHAMAIWKFLKERDNGVTNFHFEISADLLTEDEITFISRLRPGLIQLEIGVQTTNTETLKTIRRVMDIERLKEVVQQVKKPGNVHQHLDLIAGLPFEDYGSFQKSFDEIYNLHPQQLQLGFLKVLKGSYMYEMRKEYGLKYHTKPHYEIMSTNWISYEEILRIKQVEEMLEVYYNSGQYELTMQVLEKAFVSPFQMFLKLGEFYEENGLFLLNHSRIRRCEILLDFVTEWDAEHLELYQETLIFDLYYRENMKSRPRWAVELVTYKEQIRQICGKEKYLHAEPFSYDFTELLKREWTGYPKKQKEKSFYLFSYEERDKLTGQAKVIKVEADVYDKTNQRDIR